VHIIIGIVDINCPPKRETEKCHFLQTCVYSGLFESSTIRNNKYFAGKSEKNGNGLVSMLEFYYPIRGAVEIRHDIDVRLGVRGICDKIIAPLELLIAAQITSYYLKGF